MTLKVSDKAVEIAAKAWRASQRGNSPFIKQLPKWDDLQENTRNSIRRDAKRMITVYAEAAGRDL